MNQSNYLYSIINPNGESQDLFQHPIYFNYAADQDGNIYNLVKKSICTQFTNTLGYLYIWLYDNNKNRKNIKSHRFIYECLTNSIIENSKVIDHIDRDRKNNHISNLRWLSYEDNARNKLSSKGVIYEFCQYGEEPEDLIEVTDYGNHKFKKYYYSPSEDIFYYDNKAKFRQLYYNKKSDDCYYVIAKDTEGNRVNIYYNTFMKLYGLV